MSLIILCFLCSVPPLWMEPQARNKLGKHSTTESQPQPIDISLCINSEPTSARGLLHRASSSWKWYFTTAKRSSLNQQRQSSTFQMLIENEAHYTTTEGHWGKREGQRMRSWKALNKGFNKLAYESNQWAEKKAGTPSCSITHWWKQIKW